MSKKSTSPAAKPAKSTPTASPTRRVTCPNCGGQQIARYRSSRLYFLLIGIVLFVGLWSVTQTSPGAYAVATAVFAACMFGSMIISNMQRGLVRCQTCRHMWKLK